MLIKKLFWWKTKCLTMIFHVSQDTSGQSHKQQCTTRLCFVTLPGLVPCQCFGGTPCQPVTESLSVCVCNGGWRKKLINIILLTTILVLLLHNKKDNFFLSFFPLYYNQFWFPLPHKPHGLWCFSIIFVTHSSWYFSILACFVDFITCWINVLGIHARTIG